MANDFCDEIARAIEGAIPGARAEVGTSTPGHFEIRVVADAFAGKTRVEQQQLVYGAIGRFMSGPNAPVHAVDRMETVTS